MGHNLVLRIADWGATVDLDGATPTAVRLTAHLPSLEVLSGSGGLKPLTDGDRAAIRDNALKTLGAARHPEVTYASDALGPDASGLVTAGTLTIAGVGRPIEAALGVTAAEGGTQVECAVTLRQSDFGIRPFSTMMGQLKVADEVRVTLAVLVSG